MKKNLFIGLGVAALISLAPMTAFAKDAIQTSDGLLKITLPDGEWYQIISEENTEMFSDGDCAIMVNLYKNGDTLPAIQSADAKHELIYTAAASTQDYVLHVVGYAHEKADFSGICKAINSIKVDDTKITASMLNHSITTDEYSIAPMDYTAWVAASGLNVRSTSVDGSIIATLEYGDSVTVTGSVIHNGVEIGWVHIVMADGSEGYVSSQFLSTTANIKDTDEVPESDAAAERTDAAIMLMDLDGVVYTLYIYTDGSARTEDGRVFWQQSSGTYVDAQGDVLVANRSNGALYRTGNTFTVYTEQGRPYTIYEYSDGLYYDENGYSHTPDYYSDEWHVNGDPDWVVYSYDIGLEAFETQFTDSESFEVVDEYGQSVYLSHNTEDSCWYDGDGVRYYRYNIYGAYMDEYGIMYHTTD